MPAVSQAQADALAQEWIEAWNKHDLDAILAHYSDDVIFTSPFAISLTGKEDGTLHGKKELRAYWEKVGLEKQHFAFLWHQAFCFSLDCGRNAKSTALKLLKVTSFSQLSSQPFHSYGHSLFSNN
jgi:hypothetical protein